MRPLRDFVGYNLHRWNALRWLCRLLPRRAGCTENEQQHRGRGDISGLMTGDNEHGLNLRPHQPLVSDAVGLIRIRAFPSLQVLDVALIIPLEPHCFGVSLECQNVRSDAVQEPPIVRDHYHASWKIDERFLQRTKRVEIVAQRSPTFFCWSGPLKLN